MVNTKFNPATLQSQNPLTDMRRPKPKSKKFKIQSRQAEVEELELLESWIESGKPGSGSNPLSLQPLPNKSPVGRLSDGSFSRYAGCKKFSQLPLSKETKDGLAAAKYKNMTDIQRASLPHSICGRDILGAAKTGSGKTLAFVIPVGFQLNLSQFWFVFSILFWSIFMLAGVKDLIFGW